jgi:hypothetical protein
VSPSGKAPGFDPGMRRFESCHPSHFFSLNLEHRRTDCVTKRLSEGV